MPDIPTDSGYKQNSYYHSKDLVAHNVVLYRDIQQSMCVIGFVVPGSKEKKEFTIEVLTWILASGKGSRLYRILVDELELVTDIEGFLYDLFDAGNSLYRIST